MALFKLNWTLDGFRNEVHHAGAVIEADLKEVEQWVAREFGGLVHKDHAVLTPISPDESATASEHEENSEDSTTVPGANVKLSSLNKTELLAHAAEHHDLILDPTTKNADIVTAIEAAREAAAASEHEEDSELL